MMIIYIILAIIFLIFVYLIIKKIKSKNKNIIIKTPTKNWNIFKHSEENKGASSVCYFAENKKSGVNSPCFFHFNKLKEWIKENG